MSAKRGMPRRCLKVPNEILSTVNEAETEHFGTEDNVQELVTGPGLDEELIT